MFDVFVTSQIWICFDIASSNTNRKEGRVVFIVSTVNLVLQQKDRFAYFLGGKYSVGEISGANSTDIPLKYLLQSNNVVVMTAQILVNALNSNNKEERVELKDISLLLFDECHHAHKEHPYNNIMEKYLGLQSQPGYQHSLPQVLHNFQLMCPLNSCVSLWVYLWQQDQHNLVSRPEKI